MPIHFAQEQFNQASSEASSQLNDFKEWAGTELNKSKGNLSLDLQRQQDKIDYFNGAHFEDDWWEEREKRIKEEVAQVNETLRKAFPDNPLYQEYQGEIEEAQYDEAGRLFSKLGYLGQRDETGKFHHFYDPEKTDLDSSSSSSSSSSFGSSSLPSPKPLPDGPSLSVKGDNEKNYGTGVSEEINKSEEQPEKIENWVSAMYDAVGTPTISLGKELKILVEKATVITRDGLVAGFNKAKDLGKKGIDWVKENPVKAAGVAIGVGAVIVLGGGLLSAAGTIIGGAAALGKAALAPLGLGGLGSIIGALGAGGIMGGLAGVSLKSVIPWGISTIGRIWNFNWNISDEQIKQQADEAKLSIIRQTGGVLGQSLGRVICGGLGIGTTAVFSKTAAAQMMAALPEIGNEIFEEWATYLRSGAAQATQVLALQAYGSMRKLIKGWANSAALKKHFPQIGGIIEKWGEGEAWSFAIGWVNYLERLEKRNEEAAAFLEEFVEEFSDGCQDSLLSLSY